MKTTLKIEDGVMARLKLEAARRGCTMSELVESALRRMFQEKQSSRPSATLPSFHSGGHLVDVADREALHQAMKEEE